MALRAMVQATAVGAMQDGLAVLQGSVIPTAEGLPLSTEFQMGLASAPIALPRQMLGLATHLVVQPGTWAVVYLPGGERRVYEPGSYWLWGVGPGVILVQWVDARCQPVAVGPIEGWSADKWRVRLWVIVDVEVADPVRMAVHRDPLNVLSMAVRSAALQHMEQHAHAELTGGAGHGGGIDGPARAITERLAADGALEGLRIVAVRIVERQGDERQIEAATTATVTAAQITEEVRVAEARHQAQLHALQSQSVVAEREHTLRMAATAARAREQLLQQQAEVQQATLGARLQIVLAQIKAETAVIEHDEQQWQHEHARLQGEWERVQQQQLEAHRADQQVRLLGAQQGLVRHGTEVLVQAEERRNAHELALADVQRQLAEQLALRAQAMTERRAQHEHALLELHLQHEHVVAEQMQRLEQWHAEPTT
ncbi:MAG: hypothetical protein H0X37_06535 [Herpetosiphonaceae bacterium]|nr:hypothetical protein [Herpetosiphonaceae bacterium]